MQNIGDTRWRLSGPILYVSSVSLQRRQQSGIANSEVLAGYTGTFGGCNPSA
jgi:hypothetical protein